MTRGVGIGAVAMDGMDGDEMITQDVEPILEVYFDQGLKERRLAVDFL